MLSLSRWEGLVYSAPEGKTGQRQERGQIHKWRDGAPRRGGENIRIISVACFCFLSEIGSKVIS